MSKPQLDLFGNQEPASPAEPAVYRADPERVRAKLQRILAEAQAAQDMPWDWPKQALYRKLFPQMTAWLPQEEARKLIGEFDRQMERLS